MAWREASSLVTVAPRTVGVGWVGRLIEVLDGGGELLADQCAAVPGVLGQPGAQRALDLFAQFTVRQSAQGAALQPDRHLALVVTVHPHETARRLGTEGFVVDCLPVLLGPGQHVPLSL